MLCSMLCRSSPHMPEAEVGNGGQWQVPSQDGGPLPIPTNAGDQTKNQAALHVEHPTKPYQDPCPPCETHWCIWLGHGGLTRPYQSPVLAVCHDRTVLPIITGRGVKYTHNDISHLTLHTHSPRAGIRLVPEATAQEITNPYHQARPNQTDQDSWTVYDTIRRVNTVQDRWSPPHDHPMLGVRCDILHRSKLILSLIHI